MAPLRTLLATASLPPLGRSSLTSARRLTATAQRSASTSTSRSPSPSSTTDASRPAPLSRFVPSNPAPSDANNSSTSPSSRPGSRPRASSPPPPRGGAQRWSNMTLILLSTAVGASTFMIGMSQGYKAGKSQALLDSSLATPAPPPLSAAVGPARSQSVSLPTTPSSSSIASTLVSALLPSTTIHCQGRDVEPATAATATRKPADGCHLSEMVQFHCRKRPDRIICSPLDRIFRICPNRPAVEVTHLVVFDEQGNPSLPEEFLEAMPPSHHWHDLRSNEY